MPKEKTKDAFHKNVGEQFLTDAINELRKGNTTYIYKEMYLDKLKEIFNDLDITRNEFYWKVRNKEVSK